MIPSQTEHSMVHEKRHHKQVDEEKKIYPFSVARRRVFNQKSGDSEGGGIAWDENDALSRVRNQWLAYFELANHNAGMCYVILEFVFRLVIKLTNV